uniref:Uncharacterized protein MANES_04G145600 n=1 Tax=Rhizophora mucronata TaxID=61149 RepID=A0A2P2IXP6_RHIMU
MFEPLKSLYIIGFSSPWRKARPFAAPVAIFSLVNHGKLAEYLLNNCFSKLPRSKYS